MEFMIHPAFMMKSHRNPKVRGLENFQVGEPPHTRTVTHPNSTVTEAPALGALSDLASCVSSSGCSSVSFIISFNELLDIGVTLSSVSRSSI